MQFDEKKHPRDNEGKFIEVGKFGQKISKILKDNFNNFNDDVIITENIFRAHIDGNHDDFYNVHKEHLHKIIEDPDFIFKDATHKNGVIFVGMLEKTQIIIALNSTNREWKNTIITLFGCGTRTLKKLKKYRKILYQKSIDK